jgi:5'(3')-deoxyribonucleotidase
MADKRFNIGLDVDGVFADFVGGAREVCKKLFGKPDDSLVQTSWSFESLGIKDYEERLMYKEIDGTQNWWMHLKKMPNTSLLKTLTELHRVVFITNRKDGAGWPIEEQTAEWLKQQFHIYNPMVIISRDKGPVAKGLELDYYIDDRPKNVQNVVEFYPKCQTYLYRDTFNHEFKHEPEVKSFNEFANVILDKGEDILLSPKPKEHIQYYSPELIKLVKTMFGGQNTNVTNWSR